MGFAAGFNAGSAAVSRGLSIAQESEESKRRAEKHKRELEESDLRIAEGKRTARRNDQIEEAVTGLRTFTQGGTGQSRNAPEDESAEGVGISTGPRTARPYDPASPEGQIGLNTRLMDIAALKGDFAQVSALTEKNREIHTNSLLSKGIQEYFTTPDVGVQFARMTNLSHPLITAEQGQGPDGRKGYWVTTVNQAGDASRKFMTEQQAAMVYAATKYLMPVDAMAAMKHIGSVNNEIAAAIQATNQAQTQATTANNAGLHYQEQGEIGRRNAGAHERQAGASERQAGAAEMNARANATRASREGRAASQTAGQKMEEQVTALVQQYQQAYPDMSPQEVRRLALQAVTKDPDRKDPADVGLPEAGLFRINGKLYERGRDGKPALVQLPGESKLDKAIAARLAGKQPQNGNAPQAGIKPPLSPMPTMMNMPVSNAQLIREAERKQQNR